MAKEYGPKGLVIVAPSLDAEAEVLQFRKSTQAAYPMITDCDGLAKRYNVHSYPFMFLIGKDSKILWKANFKDAGMEKLLEAALAAESPAEKKPPTTVYVLKNGRRIVAVSKMEADGQLILRDDKGTMTTVQPADVAEVLKDVPAEPATQPAAKTDAATPGKPATQATTADPAPAEQPDAKPSKYPVLVLRDGRRIVAVMKMEAGTDLTVKDDSGQMHSIKKADVVETIPATK